MKTKILWIIGLCLCLGLSASAQDAPPLLRLLALTPDTESARMSIITYADYRALEAVRGIGQPTAEDFFNRTPLSGQWIAMSRGLLGGMDMSYFMSYLEGMAEAVGFDFFDIDRALNFGNPPGFGLVLEGTFDAARIAEAYQARDYNAEAVRGVPVWCPADGCAEGFRMNIAESNPANPFGGRLGRSEVLAVFSDSLLVNSADFQVVGAAVRAGLDAAPSLADAPDYAAVAGAALSLGVVTQAAFINPVHTLTFDPAALLVNGDTPTLPETGLLPPYTLAAFVDAGTADEQIAAILLAYPDAEQAAAAGAELHTRLQTMDSIRVERPWRELIAERGGELDEWQVYTDADSGWSVAVVSMRYPLPSNELNSETSSFEPSSQVYRLLMAALLQRDTLFLASDLSLWGE